MIQCGTRDYAEGDCQEVGIIGDHLREWSLHPCILGLRFSVSLASQEPCDMFIHQGTLQGDAVLPLQVQEPEEQA